MQQEQRDSAPSHLQRSRRKTSQFSSDEMIFEEMILVKMIVVDYVGRDKFVWSNSVWDIFGYIDFGRDGRDTLLKVRMALKVFVSYLPWSYFWFFFKFYVLIPPFAHILFLIVFHFYSRRDSLIFIYHACLTAWFPIVIQVMVSLYRIIKLPTTRRQRRSKRSDPATRRDYLSCVFELLTFWT